MRHNVSKVKLGSNKEHGKSMLRNLAMSLVINEKLKTTHKRAKAVQPFVEHLITVGKTKEKVTAIRELMKLINHEDTSKKILEVLVPRFEGRTSGFTRISKLGNRSGDNSAISQIELIK